MTREASHIARLSFHGEMSGAEDGLHAHQQRQGNCRQASDWRLYVLLLKGEIVGN